MEGSKPDSKKIILKKRASQDQQVDFNTEIPEDVEVAAMDATDKDASRYFYEGEIFDQFHRPLKVVGGMERLKDLAALPLAMIAPPSRDSAHQRDALSAERQTIAEALAHHIFKLAQRDRESELDVYLSAFNVALAERSCQESRDILNRANEFFTENYYAPIRERGERPEIYHQILKRVGHVHAERLQKIVFGLDVEATAKKLWDLLHGAHSDKVARISDILLDCTEFQVSAVREEFLQLPYKDLARQVYTVLHRASPEASTGSRRTIGKTEVSEHKKSAALRIRDQLRALRYLLLGRSVEELSLVKRFYLEMGEQHLPESELNLESHVRKLFPPVEIERMGPLLRGWSAHGEAEEIHKLIIGQSVRGVRDDPYSDPRDIVERDYTQGLGPFLGRFKKARLIRLSDSVNSHTFQAFQVLRERIAALSFTRFLATNQALMEFYGYELDPTLFLSLNLFDARQRATLLHERLAVTFDIFEALQPIEFLEPRQGLAVQKAYHCLFGITIREAIAQRMKALGVTMPPEEVATIIARYVHGEGRWPLNVDLLAHYRDDEAACGPWDFDYVMGHEYEERALKIGELLAHECTAPDMDRAIREYLFGSSLEALHSIERCFYELTEPHTPLQQALSDVMTPDAHSSLMVSFAGLECSSLLPKLNENPMYMTMLRDISAHDILFIRQSFKRLFYVDLVDHVVKFAEQATDRDFALEAIVALLKPEVLSVRSLLGGLKRESGPEIETLRMVCSGSAMKVMAFERAYDQLFPTFRIQLKMAAARLALSVQTFSELMLLLEGVDPDVMSRIQECFDALDIQTLQEILRSHKSTQKIIEECYDLISPERSFRYALKELHVDPDLINETLLHLEGYCSFSVAQELQSLVGSQSERGLATAVISVLTPQSSEHVNERIPQDINWMDEMIYQVGLSFRRQYGESLVVACRKRGVANEELEVIAGRVYGLEISASARELFTLIKCAKEGAQPPEGSEARICSYLESRGPKYRERLMSAYQSYWAHHPGFGGLLDDLTKYFKDSASKRKLLAMFLSTSSDRKAAPNSVPEIH
jgi:hypothetical protein